MVTHVESSDGEREILASAQNSHHVNLWLARPGSPPAFERAADLGVGLGPLGLAAADVDGDGTPEVAVACRFGDEVALVRAR